MPWYTAFLDGTLKDARGHMLSIEQSSKIVITGVTLLNSPMFFVVLNSVNGAEVHNMKIHCDSFTYNGASRSGPNTDGIDPGGGSNNIHIHYVTMNNGDDNIAVKPSSKCTQNILVENSKFSSGHGCSIGSVSSGCVQNVLFRNITMSGQENGCRIKTVQSGSSGSVKNITWEDITITDTGYCIQITSDYTPAQKRAQEARKTSDKFDLASPQAVIQISDVYLNNVKGTKCNYPAVFQCQSDDHCTGIHLTNVDTSAQATHTSMTCAYAYGTASNVKPASCLLA